MATKETRAQRIERLSKEAIAAAKADATTAEPKVKATIVDEPTTPKSEDDWMEFLRAKFGDFKMPTGRRLLVSIVAQFVLGAGIGYAAGQLISYALVGAAVLGAGAFLQWMIFVLGVFAAMYVGLKLGARVGQYIALGEIDRDIDRARNYVRGLFTRGDEVAA